MSFDLNQLLLSIQTALQTHVSPHLRAVTVDFLETEKILDFHFYYDGEITDELFDLASYTTAEVNPGMSIWSYRLNEDIVQRVDYPNKLPLTGRLVFLRKEKDAEQYILKKHEFHINYPIARLLLYLQQAMLGRVTSNLRMLSIEMTEKTIGYYFIYDCPIADEDTALANAIIEESAKPFSEYKIKKHLERIDYPLNCPTYGQRIAYQRHETLTETQPVDSY